jgi:hypothetical protein
MCMMQKRLWTALLAVPLFAVPAQAQYPGNNHFVMPPTHLNGGLTLNFNLFAGGGQTQLGPWYQYWPYDAHFQLPPPLGQSMPGPSFMTLPPQMMGNPNPGPAPGWTPPAPTPLPPGGSSGATQRTSFQPVGYYYYGSAPSYWYGR